jgi:DGQHR domain-containing protein
MVASLTLEPHKSSKIAIVNNDGQHRMAAIVEALKQNPMLANETISVVFFPFQDLDRMQQMFSDLNRTVKVTSKSLNILYDHKDLLGQLVLESDELGLWLVGKFRRNIYDDWRLPSTVDGVYVCALGGQA